MRFQKAVVTGASSGIGEALAHRLAEHGIALILVGRHAERLKAVSDALRLKVPVTAVVLDLAQPEHRAQLVDLIQQEIPDLVVNNAGLGLYGDILTYETRSQLEIVDVDVTATMELSIEAARTLVTAGKQGVILNIASAAAFQPFPGFATYSASKAFVKTFGEAFDVEVAPYGVRVLTACPGVVLTRFQSRAVNDVEHKHRRFHTISMDKAIDELWKQLQTLQPVRTFDWHYRLTAFISAYLLPRKLLFWIVKRTFLGKLPHRDLILAPQNPPKK